MSLTMSLAASSAELFSSENFRVKFLHSSKHCAVDQDLSYSVGQRDHEAVVRLELPFTESAKGFVVAGFDDDDGLRALSN